MNNDSLYVIREEVPVNEIYGGRDDFIQNEAISLKDEILGQVSLIRKRTPYVSNPSDIMLMLPDQSASQITDLTNSQGGRLLEVCTEILRVSGSRIQGARYISINQQTECLDIPQKFASDGTELKVQTFNELHAHIFIRPYGTNYLQTQATSLEEEDYYDFFDEFGIVVSKAFFQTVNPKIIENYHVALSFQENRFPIGINISSSIRDFNSVQLFEFMNFLQEEYVSFYYRFANEMQDENGVLLSRSERMSLYNKLRNSISLSKDDEKVLKTLLIATRETNLESRKHMKYIKGPALTWLLEFGATNINLHLAIKFLARGNAMESLGVWVDQVLSKDRRQQTLAQVTHYKYLIENMDPIYNAKPGRIFTHLLGL